MPAATIRRIAGEYLEAAGIGETIEIDGETLPLRPVAVTLGKSVNNGWGAYECCWARTVLASLVGALENPGGTLGTTVRLNRPQDNRHLSVKPGEDGFMVQHFNPTGQDSWEDRPTTRNLHRTLVPIVGHNGGWSQALGPTQLAWMLAENLPDDWNFPKPTFPEFWFVYRSNPAISFWQTRLLADADREIPVHGRLRLYGRRNQLHGRPAAAGGDRPRVRRNSSAWAQTKYMEHFWDHIGVVLRQKAVEPQGDARDFSWIATELAKRTSLLPQYVAAVEPRHFRRVAAEGRRTTTSASIRTRTPQPDEIWDAVCRAATATLSEGKETHGLDWFKEHGFYAKPVSRLGWYLTPTLAKQGLRYELPYQERLMRVGVELGKRLHERNMHWWDEQLKEYVALPDWHDVPGRWERALVNAGAQAGRFSVLAADDKEHAIPFRRQRRHRDDGRGVREFARTIPASCSMPRTAAKLGIREGDRVEVRSHIGATYGKAALMKGVRPDTIVILGQFDHWATPYIKDTERASLNTIAPMSIELTDATGSGADIVRVAVRRMERATAA